MQQKRTILFLLFVVAASRVVGQSNSESAPQKRAISTTSLFEAHNLQFATMSNNGVSLNVNPRYSYYFNLGVDFNVNITSRLKPFTGIYVKNIGVIVKEAETVTKHRGYYLGAPLGVKVYSKNHKNYLKLGTDFNYALNYKQKTFVDGDKKDKFNEWGSDRIVKWYPSIFAGFQYEGLSMCLNYYYNNFFNTEYTNNGVRPYSGADVQMVTVSFGYHIDNKSAQRKLKQRIKKSRSEVKS